MRYAIIFTGCVVAALLSVGCEVRVIPPQAVVVAPPPVAVIDAPGVAVSVEPVFADRVYVYDPGFPPGVYLYGGFYYYGGHRYDRDVFINRVVHVNIQRHLYMDVDAKRHEVDRAKEADRAHYAKTGGRVQPAARREDQHRDEHHDEH